MSDLIVSNREINYLNKINLENYKKNKIYVGNQNVNITDFDMYNSNLVAISKEDLFLIDIKNEEILERIEIGIDADKIKIYKENALLLSSYSNSLIIYNLLLKEIKLIYKLNDYPSCIDIDKEEEKIYITSFLGGSIQIFDCKNYFQVNQICNLNYPTKIAISEDCKYLFVLESNCNLYEDGVLSIFDKKSLEKTRTIKLGKIPTDLVQINNILAICNFDDNIINIIDLENERVTFFNICGMVSRMVRKDNSIICMDYINGTIKLLDFKHKNEKIIAKGSNPNAMIIV